MARRPAQDVTVGAVFALALIILALAVMVVGGDSGLFFKQVRYSVVFDHASGLLVGAPAPREFEHDYGSAGAWPSHFES